MKRAYDYLKTLESIDLEILDDFEIKFENVALEFPVVYIYPNQEPPLIRVIGNKPSLIRYAIADLLLHEYVEYIFHICNQDYEGDSHENQEFQEMEREAKRRLLKAIEKQDI